MEIFKGTQSDIVLEINLGNTKKSGLHTFRALICPDETIPHELESSLQKPS